MSHLEASVGFQNARVAHAYRELFYNWDKLLAKLKAQKLTGEGDIYESCLQRKLENSGGSTASEGFSIDIIVEKHYKVIPGDTIETVECGARGNHLA